MMSQRRASMRVQAPALVTITAGTIAAAAWMLLIQPSARPHSQGIIASWMLWMLMMIAMMLPPVMPWMRAYAAVARRARRTTAFGAGYFVIWGVFALAAAATQIAVAQQGGLQLRLIDSHAGIAAALLVGAGIYQLIPAKSACLKHCRSPISFFLTSWRGGRWGALLMGTEHGAYCVGCCWALMVLAFVVGTMNVVWMAVLTLVLCIEKIAARGLAWSRFFGIALITWGALVAVLA